VQGDRSDVPMAQNLMVWRSLDSKLVTTKPRTEANTEQPSPSVPVVSVGFNVVGSLYTLSQIAELAEGTPSLARLRAGVHIVESNRESVF
jgi:hypothetical protein